MARSLSVENVLALASWADRRLTGLDLGRRRIEPLWLGERLRQLRVGGRTFRLEFARASPVRIKNGSELLVARLPGDLEFGQISGDK